MSPFACFLKCTRQSRGLSQKAVATLLGYEQSYLSALERSHKGPPKQEFIDRLVRGLALSQREQAELREALAKSKRQFSLPCPAPIEQYELIQELAPKLGRLHPMQVKLIQLALRMPEALSAINAEPDVDSASMIEEKEDAMH